MDWTRRWVGRRELVAVAAAASLMAALLSAPTTALEAANQAEPGDPDITVLGRAPSGYSLGRPSLLVTDKGVVLAAWRQYLKAPNSLQVARKKLDGRFKKVSVPTGNLTTFGEPYLTADPANNRILLTASGYADGVANLGLYLWTSKNGRSWSQPRMVWDSFSSGQIALDGKGGFYAITDQTGVSVTHVPASLVMQHYPDDSIVLSDRISSRGAVDVATTGKNSELLFAFAADEHTAFVHAGTTPGAQYDTQAAPYLGPGADSVQVAGDRKAAVMVAISTHSAGPKFNPRLYANTVVPQPGFAPQLTDHYIVNKANETVVAFAVNALSGQGGRATGRFLVVWLSDDGRLRTSRSIDLERKDWTKPETVLKFPTQTYQFPDSLETADGWIAVHGRDKKLTEAELVLHHQ